VSEFAFEDGEGRGPTTQAGSWAANWASVSWERSCADTKPIAEKA
jgi:hypothetical protein